MGGLVRLSFLSKGRIGEYWALFPKTFAILLDVVPLNGGVVSGSFTLKKLECSKQAVML